MVTNEFVGVAGATCQTQTNSTLCIHTEIHTQYRSEYTYSIASLSRIFSDIVHGVMYAYMYCAAHINTTSHIDNMRRNLTYSYSQLYVWSVLVYASLVQQSATMNDDRERTTTQEPYVRFTNICESYRVDV